MLFLMIFKSSLSDKLSFELLGGFTVCFKMFCNVNTIIINYSIILFFLCVNTFVYYKLDVANSLNQLAQK